MREFYAEFKDKGVQVIGVTGFQGRISYHGAKKKSNISRRKELRLMKKFIRHQEVTWPIAFSDRNCYDPEYGIDAIPRIIVIDKGVPGSGTMAITVVCTVALSVLLHGLTARPFSAWFAAATTEPNTGS